MQKNQTGKHNLKCPFCGHINEGLLLDETDGWYECANCKSEVFASEIMEMAKRSCCDKEVSAAVASK